VRCCGHGKGGGHVLVQISSITLDSIG